MKNACMYKLVGPTCSLGNVLGNYLSQFNNSKKSFFYRTSTNSRFQNLFNLGKNSKFIVLLENPRKSDVAKSKTPTNNNDFL